MQLSRSAPVMVASQILGGWVARTRRVRSVTTKKKYRCFQVYQQRPSRVTDLFSSPFHFSVPLLPEAVLLDHCGGGPTAGGRSGGGRRDRRRSGGAEPDYFFGAILLLDGTGRRSAARPRARAAPVRDRRRTAAPRYARHSGRRAARPGDRAMALGRAQQARPAGRSRYGCDAAAGRALPRRAARTRAGIPGNARADTRRLRLCAAGRGPERGRGAAARGARALHARACRAR